MSRVKSTLQILEAQFKRKRNNAEALAAVLRVHPRSSMTPSTVNWYRNKMRRGGMNIPLETELR